MKNLRFAVLPVAAVSALLSACGGGGVCDKNDSLNLAAKAGSCQGVTSTRPLGTKTACTTALSSCSGADQNILTASVACLEKLPNCSPGAEADWNSQQNACYASYPDLSEACRTALFGSNVIPGQDGGMDAGEPDAGRQPQTDGGTALDFVVVADEKSFAMGWSSRQRAQVDQWELNVLDGDGGRLPEIYISPGSSRAYLIADAGAGVTRSFYVAAVTADKMLLYGQAPDAGQMMAGDAGMMCMVSANCPVDRVCDLGQCKPQSCQPGGAVTCPVNYICRPNALCERIADDGGVRDAGVVDAGVGFVPLPLLSELVKLTTAPPMFAAPQFVGGFSGRRPDMVAIDSARQFVALEQENQPFGYPSSRRGKDLVSGATANAIDTVGTNVKLTYVAESDTVFACYNVGRGVRVRRSRDLGRTWGTTAATIEPEEDGGFSSRYQDCDIAPWKNGGALMVSIDEDRVVVRTISETLNVGAPEVAFISASPDAGLPFNPQRPTIATAPAQSIVHVGFTATRPLNMSTDTEPYAVYRDGTTGVAFSNPELINNNGLGGTGFPQDHVQIAVDPNTRRAVAAYTALENAGADTYATVYLAIFNPTTKKWATGSDLTVFAKNAVATGYPVFPARSITEVWTAFSPQLARQPDGRIWLSMLAGPVVSGATDLRMYLVGFDFDKLSEIGTGKGWFLPPAVKMSEIRALDPRTGGNAPPPTITSLTADGQLSIYGAFIEGVGQFGEIENRPVFISRP